MKSLWRRAPLNVGISLILGDLILKPVHLMYRGQIDIHVINLLNIDETGSPAILLVIKTPLLSGKGQLF